MIGVGVCRESRVITCSEDGNKGIPAARESTAGSERDSNQGGPDLEPCNLPPLPTMATRKHRIPAPPPQSVSPLPGSRALTLPFQGAAWPRAPGRGFLGVVA